ncbi:MAG: DUF1302 domain-containing protein [Sinimarinibacterium flocculans]|uniref:DUF1302 domain-containing protein n=1 Tax=Sinimarinibacterium flocculans TaxID=985250 RepID=UPI003C5E03C6
MTFESMIWKRCGLAAAAVLTATSASAIDLDFDLLGTDVRGALNNTVTFGYAWRIEDRDDRLVGKSALNPDVCTGQYQSCQGLHREQSFPSERVASAPGMASLNFDDGNLNYDKYDITQAPLKLSQDVKLEFGDGTYVLFARGIGIFDYVNYGDFEEQRYNLITPENVDRVGIQGQPSTGNRYFERSYGPGERTTIERATAEAKQNGLRYDLLDLNFFGSPILGGREVIFRIGRQTVNWGQSTVAVINSVNQAQPVNANSLYRLGFGLLEELFVPVGMARLATSIVDGVTIDAYYQYEWEPIEIPTPGSYMSFLDLGTDNLRRTVHISFGGSADDPDQVGAPLNSPLALITPTTLNINRRPDREARDDGQFGIALKYYAEWLNQGTELGAYFMNYHSKLPYASFYATDASCARAEGNPDGINATNTAEFLKACPNMLAAFAPARTQLLADVVNLAARRPGAVADFGTDLLSILSGLIGDASQPISDALPLDTAEFQLEYPEDLQMYGVDFTTTFGDYSFQGEVSYRPNLPLQVALVDLAFAAFGPTLTRCHDEALGCAGAQAGLGFDEAGDYVVYDGNDHTDAEGNNPYPDSVNLIVGAAPGSARSFPNFITPYRGGAIGENSPNSYIQGWIPGKVMQYNLGATRVLGASENWIFADQVVLLYELAATHVLNLPKFDQLQIEGPYTATTHASAGADGSGADGSRLACSTNPSCSVGVDGLRFNPFQAPRSAFADSFSWGYRVVGRILYENVLPGIGLAPIFIWQHDITGNAPGPAGNFVEGRRSFNLLLETRFTRKAAITLSYNHFSGAGANNVYLDRDNLGFFVKYQF